MKYIFALFFVLHFSACSFNVEERGQKMQTISSEAKTSLLQSEKSGDLVLISPKLISTGGKEPISPKLKREIGQKYIALSFDDGPNKKITPQILDILNKYDIHATFYVLGANVEQFPDLLRETHALGHEIGNHGWDHQNLTSLDESWIFKQIQQTDQIILKTLGVHPATFRPPYGSYNEKIASIVLRPIILWNVDSFDWKNRRVDSNIANVLEQTQDGSIILLHDIHQASADALEIIIQELKKQNYTFITVSELLDLYQEKNYIQKMCSSGYTCKNIPKT